MDDQAPRILLVDDEPSALEALEQAISWSGQRLGWQVTAMDSPQVALEAAQARPFDLIITDLHMPSMNGLDLIREMKRILPNLRALLLTASASLSGFLKELRITDAKVLVKPCALIDLIHAIHEVLELGVAAVVAPRQEETLPITQTLHHQYGLQFSHHSDVVEYLPLDAERLALLLLQTESPSVPLELLRLGLRQQCERLLRSGRSPTGVLHELQQLIQEHASTSEVGVFVGIFNRRRRTFSHAQIGFRSASLRRAQDFQDLEPGTINLHARDVVRLSMHEELSPEDALDDHLHITIAWGKSAQMEFSFSQGG